MSTEKSPKHIYACENKLDLLQKMTAKQCNLVLSTGLIVWIGHRKEIRKLTFRALALRPSESIRSDEGPTLETSAFQSLYGGQF